MPNAAPSGIKQPSNGNGGPRGVSEPPCSFVDVTHQRGTGPHNLSRRHGEAGASPLGPVASSTGPDTAPQLCVRRRRIRVASEPGVVVHGCRSREPKLIVELVDHCRWITAPLLGHISKVLIKRDYPLTVDGGWVLRRSDLDDLCLNLVAATYIKGATESAASRDSPPGSYRDF